MAHYSSDSHLWTDQQFLKCDRLQRLIVLYIMHGPGRSNVPGLCEDNAVTIADRLEEKVDVVRDALQRMCDDGVLEMEEEMRLLRCPLATRMDPYRGSKTMRGWHKNWVHMVESKIKYAHIVQLMEKVDRSKEAEVTAWNETFGAEENRRHRLTATEPAQQNLLPEEQQGRQKPQLARQAERLKAAGPLPGRDGAEHMDEAEYVQRFAADLVDAGITSEMGATATMIAPAMGAFIKKKKGELKRAVEWDPIALIYVEKQITIEGLNKLDTRGHTHEDHRPSGGAARRTSRPRDRGAAEENKPGQWSEVIRRKTAATIAAANS